jgi:hypothetical protein
MRESLNIGKSWFELAQQLNDAFSLVLGAKAFGNRGCFLVWALYVADGLRSKHKLSASALHLIHSNLKAKPAQ